MHWKFQKCLNFRIFNQFWKLRWGRFLLLFQWIRRAKKIFEFLIFIFLFSSYFGNCDGAFSLICLVHLLYGISIIVSTVSGVFGFRLIFSTEVASFVYGNAGTTHIHMPNGNYFVYLLVAHHMATNQIWLRIASLGYLFTPPNVIVFIQISSKNKNTLSTQTNHTQLFINNNRNLYSYFFIRESLQVLQQQQQQQKVEKKDVQSHLACDTVSKVNSGT